MISRLFAGVYGQGTRTVLNRQTSFGTSLLCNGRGYTANGDTDYAKSTFNAQAVFPGSVVDVRRWVGEAEIPRVLVKSRVPDYSCGLAAVRKKIRIGG